MRCSRIPARVPAGIWNENGASGKICELLPDPFRRKLHDAGRTRADAPELRRIHVLNGRLCFAGRGCGDGGCKAGAAKHELRVIEGVEQLGANLRFESFVNGKVFYDSQIEIIYTGAVEGVARQCAESSECWRGEISRRDVNAVRLANVESLQRPG